MEDSEIILNKVYDFFIESNDFNGIALTKLSEEVKIDYIKVIDTVNQLVAKDFLSIQSGTNPHIIALGHFPINMQLKILEDAKSNKTEILGEPNEFFQMRFDSHLVCIYPSQSYLKTKRDFSSYSKLPYTGQLALGEPNLKGIFFEIEVLDRYSKDPRYSFEFEDYSGQICYKDDKNNVPLVDENDKIFLKSFGLGFDEDKNRLVVAYLCYLKGLTSEHQLYWKSKEIKREARMLKEYYTNTIEGDWTNSYSVFSAFLGEQKALNDITKAVFGETLFNRTFKNENRPKEFTFFFIPTLNNYHEFVLLLDKIISDNINKSFFKGKLELYDIIEFESGVVERKEKGTLRLFEEWLSQHFNTGDPELLKELFKPLKSIRQERQKPAHKILENVYDKSLIEKQKELITAAYNTIRTLRKIFQLNEKAKDVKTEDWLDEGEIKIF